MSRDAPLRFKSFAARLLLNSNLISQHIDSITQASKGDETLLLLENSFCFFALRKRKCFKHLRGQKQARGNFQVFQKLLSILMFLELEETWGHSSLKFAARLSLGSRSNPTIGHLYCISREQQYIIPKRRTPNNTKNTRSIVVNFNFEDETKNGNQKWKMRRGKCLILWCDFTLFINRKTV